jgi:Kef-type K+ transport system membrane component KefB
VASWLKQPLILAYIVMGVAAGPALVGWAAPSEALGLLAEFGVTLLLFAVGLKLDPQLVRHLGPVAVATGLGQLGFTIVVGFGLCLLLGYDAVAALYIAIALTFSSTIIIVKLLSDKREIDALHGRIAVGFLIVQDIMVVLAMILLSAFGAGGGETDLGLEIGKVLLTGIGMLIGVGLLMRYVLPVILPHLARSQELLVLASIALAVVMAAMGELLGFSKEVGAFLAGIALASTPYREAIGARLVSLRDFLLLFFFIALGSKLDMGTLGAQIGPAVLFSLFVLIGNPLIVMIIMGAMGYRKRTGFLAGLTVAQISEFSLILAALGLSLGHIDTETVGLITLVGLITIGLSTYMILYSHPLYERLAPWLNVFERREPFREALLDGMASSPDADVIIFGLGRYGSHVAEGLRQRGYRVLGVDFDPEIVDKWHRQGLPAHYGDAEDPEFPATLPLYQTRWVISTMPERQINLTLFQALRNHGYRGQVALAAHTQLDADNLRAANVDLVLMPFADAAERAVVTLDAQMDGGTGREDVNGPG